MMKKLLFLITLLGLFWSCKPESPTVYTHVVPANATELALVRLDALVEKAGWKEEANQAALLPLLNLLLEGEPRVQEEVTRWLKEPAATGIDWHSPLLLFQAPGLRATALALRISDLPKWESVVDALVQAELLSSPEKGKAGRRTTLADGSIGLFYNDGTLVLLYADSPSQWPSLYVKADELLSQREEQSICRHPHYEALTRQAGDISLLATTESLPFDLRGILKHPAGTQLLGRILFTEGGMEAEVRQAGFEGESGESSQPFRPSNSLELLGALQHVMNGRPFHLELGREELLTVSNVGVLMEYAPDDPQLKLLVDLIEQVESLTLRGDSRCTRFVLRLQDQRQNALKQLVGFAQQHLSHFFE